MQQVCAYATRSGWKVRTSDTKTYINLRLSIPDQRCAIAHIKYCSGRWPLEIIKCFSFAPNKKCENVANKIIFSLAALISLQI